MARVTKKNVLLAKKTWDRYATAMTNGHADFQIRANKNEGFYLGGGRQWDEALKKELEDRGKPWLEPNLIFSIINTVTGYQTQTRLDIAYKPREADDQELSDLLSKISMHVLDQNHYPWVESQTFADGIIQSRGYMDIRMEFDENMYGNIKIVDKDPLDIIPDPDAKSYDPDEWADVMETRWMTVDNVEELYGRAKALEVARTNPNESDFGIGEIGAERNKFAEGSQVAAWTGDEERIPHVRVIERQWWKLQLREFYMDNSTGDLRAIPDGLSNKEKNRNAKENDYTIIKRMSKRVRWTVTTQDVVLHDDWSPYDHFTIVPYFPYFRRGVTIGLIDNLISTQEMFNKVFSQILHVVNSSANSGWVVEENSLTNMDTEDLEDIGSTTGLVMEYKAGREKPEKIKHNEIPTGLDRMADKAASLLSTIAGVSDVFQGHQGNEITGVAIQSRVQQNAVQLAAPLDNLYRSRHILAQRILELIQNFYTEERVFNVTTVNEDTNEPENQAVSINEYDEVAGEYLNDTTQGRYDVVVSDVPNQVTFQNSQFAQAVELRKFGVEIPDDVMVQLSGLSNKNELAKRMSGQGDPEAEQMQKEQMQLELDTLKEELKKIKSESNSRNIKSLKDAVEAAELMVEKPEVAVVAQQLVDAYGLEPEQEQPPAQEMGPPEIGQQMSPEEQMAMIEQEQMMEPE